MKDQVATAYHKYVYKTCNGSQKEIAMQLGRDCMNQNEQTFETLTASGLTAEKPLTLDDLENAAKYLIELVEKGISQTSNT